MARICSRYLLAIAAEKPRIEVHPLGIGGKADPARLVFEGKKGDALLTTMVDMGGRFRMISHDIHAIAPMKKMPKLPVASVMWRPEPDMITGNEAWILCGRDASQRHILRPYGGEYARLRGDNGH